MAPRKVSIFADADQIKNIYADETSVLKPCTTCSFTIADNNGTQKLKRSEAKKLKSIVSRRVSRFYQLFQPMLDFLLVNRYALFNKQKKTSDVEMIPTDHIIVVHLADLPNDADADKAVRPHLRIDKLEPRAVSDLSDEEKATLHKEWSAQRPEEYRISHLVSYTFAEGHTWTTIRTSSYDFNPLIVGRVNNRVLMERLIAFAQGINEIARGSRPDLYEMIRNQIKETRKQEVGVSLSTLVVEEGRGGGGGGGATNSIMLW